jgi:Flp pilus assembly protein protease CpaA
VIALLLLISIIDVRSHRIPNWSIIAMIGLQALSSFPNLNPEFVPASIIIGAILYRYCGVGAGDIKLIATLVTCGIESHEISHFATGLAIGGLISSALFLLRYRRISIHIPLAPAITVGFISAHFM